MAVEAKKRLNFYKERVEKTLEYSRTNLIALLKELSEKAEHGVTLEVEYAIIPNITVTKAGIDEGNGITSSIENAVSYMQVNIGKWKKARWEGWDDIETDKSILNMIALGAERANIVLEGKYLPKYPINP